MISYRLFENYAKVIIVKLLLIEASYDINTSIYAYTDRYALSRYLLLAFFYVYIFKRKIYFQSKNFYAVI